LRASCISFCSARRGIDTRCFGDRLVFAQPARIAAAASAVQQQQHGLSMGS